MLAGSMGIPTLSVVVTLPDGEMETHMLPCVATRDFDSSWYNCVRWTVGGLAGGCGMVRFTLVINK